MIPPRRPGSGRALIATALLGAALCGCSSREPAAGSLEQIEGAGQVRFVVRNAPTSWYIDRDDQPAGPSYDLGRAFADWLGVEAVFVVEDTTPGVLAAIEQGRADIAAAGLTATEARGESFLLGPGGFDVTEQVVCHRQGPRPSNIAELADVGLVVTAGSSYVETLERLREQHPDLEYETSTQSTEQLLAAVFERTIECTVADSHIVAINRRYYPALTVEFDLAEPGELVWVMPPDARDLAAKVAAWAATEQAAQAREGIVERYFSFVDLYDYVDLREFIRRIETRYDKLAPLFAEAGDEYEIDPLLLAAQAYQESHWNARARSPTGVRGIMMLTLPTAKSVGVQNRLDPQQSIRGGARYLDKMRGRLEEDLPEPDRTYLALAAYNVGFAHLRDARTLAEERGLDPGSWIDVRSVLPLLADPAVYKKLPYGYARGIEPVRYVERIRNYADVLAVKLNERDGSGSSDAVPGTDAGVAEDEG
jgi:membrane-bound lytic murein transglycosylase F